MIRLQCLSWQIRPKFYVDVKHAAIFWIHTLVLQLERIFSGDFTEVNIFTDKTVR